MPGYDGDDQEDAALLAQAQRIGWPVLIKPARGGGGKGMRAVRAEGDFGSELAASRREARAAFGDDRVVLERLVDRPRHVEVQVLGDGTGALLHLFERECSIQRRHQKVVEETPSPALDSRGRAELCAAGVAAARAAGYVNAGTVEFLMAPDGAFYFLEMNTRLQVEHPVTEAVTGLDLVRLQLEVAAGRPLPFTQENVVARGHALECRLYAEDPAQGDLPSPGTILHLSAPAGPGVRFDSGVETGSEVTVHYDPLLAKLVTWGADRAESVERMAGSARAHGRARRGHEPARACAPSWTTRHSGRVRCTRGSWTSTCPDRPPTCARRRRRWRRRPRRCTGGARPRRAARGRTRPIPGPRSAPGGSERTPDAARVRRRRAGGHRPRGPRRARGDRGRARVRRGRERVRARHLRLSRGPPRRDVPLRARRPGRPSLLAWARPTACARKPSARAPRTAAGPSGLTAPMPGRVIAVKVEPGQHVTRGQELLVVESMKMENAIRAPREGTVRSVAARVGEMVGPGVVLVELE